MSLRSAKLRIAKRRVLMQRREAGVVLIVVALSAPIALVSVRPALFCGQPSIRSAGALYAAGASRIGPASAAPSAASVDDWVRTAKGWEHATWRRAAPRRLPHPAVVGAFLLLASMLALAAFPVASAEN